MFILFSNNIYFRRQELHTFYWVFMWCLVFKSDLLLLEFMLFSQELWQHNSNNVFYLYPFVLIPHEIRVNSLFSFWCELHPRYRAEEILPKEMRLSSRSSVLFFEGMNITLGPETRPLKIHRVNNYLLYP